MSDQSNQFVAGVDEAGRGPLAGPVVAAAVILNPEMAIDGLADSKTLTALQRERLAEKIKASALAWAVGISDVAEIDHHNILQATFIAMQRAVAGLSIAPGHVLVDGNRCPRLPCSATAIVKGDQKEPAISAASILAKVTRDAMMMDLDRQFPDYGFARHKGYPSKEHIALLRRHGVTSHHRRSFAPVRALVDGNGA